MSKESAQEFIKRLLEDKEFSKKISLMKTPKEMVKEANKSGYNFTVEEIKELKNNITNEDDKLDYATMENITGGKSPGEIANDRERLDSETNGVLPDVILDIWAPFY